MSEHQSSRDHPAKICFILIVQIAYCFKAKVVGACQDDQFRLHGGSNSTNGYVQILQNKTWYNVCMNGWSRSNGESLCIQMGYSGFLGYSEPVQAETPDEQTTVKYRTFASCTGTEECLSNCEGHSWEIAPYFEPSPNGISYCYFNQDQLIYCKERTSNTSPTYGPNITTEVMDIYTDYTTNSTSNNVTKSPSDVNDGEISTTSQFTTDTISTSFTDTEVHANFTARSKTFVLTSSNSGLVSHIGFDPNGKHTTERDNTKKYINAESSDYLSNDTQLTSPVPVTLSPRNTKDQGYNSVYVKNDAPKQSGCPGYETTFLGNSLYGQITSPNYNKHYPNNLSCSWSIQVDSSKIIQLLVIDFKTQENKDILRIFKSGLGIPYLTLSGPYSAKTSENRASGNNDSVIIEIDSPSMILEFITDNSITDRGFKIEYKAISANNRGDVSEKDGDSEVPAWALGVLAIILIILFACLLAAWTRKNSQKKHKQDRALQYEKPYSGNNGDIFDGDMPQDDHDSTYSVPSTLRGKKVFTSGKISVIDTNSGGQGKKLGHNGSQRRVAFQNTAFSQDPNLWEVNDDVPDPAERYVSDNVSRKSSEGQMSSTANDSVVFGQHTNNNNSGYPDKDTEHQVYQPTIVHTPDHLFTASEFINQHCPVSQQGRRASEPRTGGSVQDNYRDRKLSIGNIPDKMAFKGPGGTLDLVIAVPFTQNTQPEDIAGLIREAGPDGRSADGHSIASPINEDPGKQTFKSNSNYRDLSQHPSSKYTVNSTVDGQAYLDWDINEIPREFVCPISNKIMKQPIVGPDGVTYEKRALFDWLENHGYTSPVTKQPMSKEQLTLDLVLKSRIAEWKLRSREHKKRIETTARKSSNALCGDVQC